MSPVTTTGCGRLYSIMPCSVARHPVQFLCSYSPSLISCSTRIVAWARCIVGKRHSDGTWFTSLTHRSLPAHQSGGVPRSISQNGSICHLLHVVVTRVKRIALNGKMVKKAPSRPLEPLRQRRLVGVKLVRQEAPRAFWGPLRRSENQAAGWPRFRVQPDR